MSELLFVKWYVGGYCKNKTTSSKVTWYGENTCFPWEIRKIFNKVTAPKNGAEYPSFVFGNPQTVFKKNGIAVKCFEAVLQELFNFSHDGHVTVVSYCYYFVLQSWICLLLAGNS